MNDPIVSDLRTRMDKCLQSLQGDLIKIRTGRASPVILQDVKVNYYGALTPLSQVATVNVPDPRLIVLAPWDPKMIPEIEKAILKSDLGLNPTNDGKIVRLAIPALTEERRKEFVKMAKKMGEEGKIAVRHVRRDAMDLLKKKEKEEHASKDDVKHLTEEVEKVTQSYIEKIDLMIAAKEKELMEV